MTAETSHSPKIAAIYLRTLEKFAATYGIHREQLYECFEVDHVKNLSQIHLPIAFFTQVVERLGRLSKDPLLAIRLGQHLTIEAHGFLGYAAKSSLTIREALQMDVSYLPTLVDNIRFELSEFQGVACLKFIADVEETAHKQFIVECLLSCLSAMQRQMMVRDDFIPIVHVCFDDPEYDQSYELLGHHVTLYCQPRNCIFFPVRILDEKLATYDPILKELAEKQCRDQLLSVIKKPSVTEKVQQIIRHNITEPPALDQLAKQLTLSSRTLKRRLEEEGSSYRGILGEIRCELACQQLTSSTKTIAEVAYLVGYNSASNFTRAFKEWTGISPQSYLRQFSTNGQGGDQ